MSESKIKNILPTTTVYRIVKLEHLINDIENEIITFAHPSSFDDIKESQKQDALFVQCWSKERESPMMWELYSKDKLGIMIKFDVEHFKNYNTGMGNSFKPFVFNNYWRDIEYDFKEFENKNKEIESLEYLFHKREGYVYEKECRWVIDLRKTSWHPITKIVGGIYKRYPKIITSYNNGKYKKLIQVPFEHDLWNTIISEIIIDPRANNDYFRYVKELLTVIFDKNRYNPINISRSTFWDNEESIEDSNSDETTQLYYFSKGRFDLVLNNIKNDDNIEALKIGLFSMHDSLLFSNFSTGYLELDIHDKEINTLLEENDIIINFYVTSYLIMHVIKAMYTAIIWSRNHLFYKDMYKLVKKMFILMNNFLLDEFKVTKYITDDFINKIIKFWVKEESQQILLYYDDWKETYLICQEYINKISTNTGAIGRLEFSTAHERLLSNNIYNFFQIIIKSYNESIDNHKTKK